MYCDWNWDDMCESALNDWRAQKADWLTIETPDEECYVEEDEQTEDC